MGGGLRQVSAPFLTSVAMTGDCGVRRQVLRPTVAPLSVPGVAIQQPCNIRLSLGRGQRPQRILSNTSSTRPGSVSGLTNANRRTVCPRQVVGTHRIEPSSAAACDHDW